MKNKNKITFLDVVIPFVVAYTIMIIIYGYIKPMNNNSLLDVVIICLLSFLLIYGFFSFIRDWSIISKKIIIKYAERISELFNKILQ